MISETELASLIIDITDNGRITKACSEPLLAHMNTPDGIIELINVIFVIHRTRCLECANDDFVAKEFKNFVQDFRLAFSTRIMSDELLDKIFSIGVCNNFKSVKFRETCVDIMSLIPTCEMVELQYLLYKRVIRYILDYRLYTGEPFIGIMREATSALSDIKTKHGMFTNQLLLE